MSNATHIIRRRRLDTRKAQQINKVTQYNGYRFVQVTHTSTEHKQPNSWWRERYADLVERRQPDGSYTPKPQAAKPPAVDRSGFKATMQPRPEGMTRQQQRQLFRRSCKAMGVPWRKAE